MSANDWVVPVDRMVSTALSAPAETAKSIARTRKRETNEVFFHDGILLSET